MSAEEAPGGAVMTRHRLAAIVEGIDGQDPAELEALLRALTSAAWPSTSALDQ